jgi:hypothetical protein
MLFSFHFTRAKRHADRCPSTDGAFVRQAEAVRAERREDAMRARYTRATLSIAYAALRAFGERLTVLPKAAMLTPAATPPATAALFSALRLPRIGKRPAKAKRLPPIGNAGCLIDVADEAGRRGRREAVGEAIPSRPRQPDIVGVMRPVARRHGEQMADFLEPAADFLDRVANGEIGYPLLFGEAVRLMRRGMHIDFDMYDVGAGCPCLEPPHGGIKSLRYLLKIKDLAALTTSRKPHGQR